MVVLLSRRRIVLEVDEDRSEYVVSRYEGLGTSMGSARSEVVDEVFVVSLDARQRWW